MVPSFNWQLGLGYRGPDLHGKACLLSLVRDELQIDGADAQGSAEARSHKAAIRSRSSAVESGDDGVVQNRKDKSVRWLSAYLGANPGIHLSLLGIARERRNATGALDVVDKRFVGQRPLLCIAARHGRDHVSATTSESTAT